jgi:hypothetical protein
MAARVIWKFDLATGVAMPAGAIILCVQWNDGGPQLWATVDPDAPKRTRRLRVYGTGRELASSPGNYVGTFQDGPFVWHVFDEGEVALS